MKKTQNKRERRNFLSESLPSSDSGSEYQDHDGSEDDLLNLGTKSSTSDCDVGSDSSRSLIDEVEDLQTPNITNTDTVEAISHSFYQYLISADCGNKDP